MKNTYALRLAFLLLPACVNESPLAHKTCPCATGYVCCEPSNRCEISQESCPVPSAMDGGSADTAYPPLDLGLPDAAHPPVDLGSPPDAMTSATDTSTGPSRWQKLPETSVLDLSSMRRRAVLMGDRLTVFTESGARNETWSYRFVPNDWVRVSQGPMQAYSSLFVGTVWTGTQLLFWGGSRAAGMGPMLLGGLYDPLSDSWSPVNLDGALALGVEGSAYTGQEAFMYGTTSGADQAPQTGVFYNPSADRWRAVPTLNAPTAALAAVVGLGSRIVIWGGLYIDPTGAWIYVADGAVYDPGTDTWTSTATLNAPGPRSEIIAFAAGGQAFLWGGTDGTSNSLGEQTIFRDGAMYDPMRDLWTPIAKDNSPVRALGGFWAEEQGLAYLWAGQNSPGATLSVYNPVAETWAAFDISDLPSLQQVSFHWTGASLLAIGFEGPETSLYVTPSNLRMTGYLFTP